MCDVGAEEERELGAGAREAEELIAQLVLPPQASLFDDFDPADSTVEDGPALSRRALYS